MKIWVVNIISKYKQTLPSDELLICLSTLVKKNCIKTVMQFYKTENEQKYNSSW